MRNPRLRVGGNRENCSAEGIWGMRMGNGARDGEILIVKLQNLHASGWPKSSFRFFHTVWLKIWMNFLANLICKHRIGAREGGHFKGISFSPGFPISHFCRPRISLQGTYANFYLHSNLPPAGFSVPDDFNQSLFLLLYLHHFTWKVLSLCIRPAGMTALRCLSASWLDFWAPNSALPA